MKVLFISLLILSLMIVGIGFYYSFYIENEEPFVPIDYESPKISKEQGEKYRNEEQQLYDELNYEGVKEYTIEYGK